MKQYNAIKAKYPDALLLFRVGDFYETFGSDAILASKILNIILTSRANGGSRIELAGFPHHSLDTYLPKLVRAGHRVAICDQLEDPKQTKKIVKRGVTELVTPGVSYNNLTIDSTKNNFLASIFLNNEKIGVAFLDISTGEFLVSEGNYDYVSKLIEAFRPSEVIYQKEKRDIYLDKFKNDIFSFAIEEWVYSYDYAYDILLKQFSTNSLKGFGIDNLQEATIAAGAIMYYLDETKHSKTSHVLSINRIDEHKYLWMDKFTMRNLELFYSPHFGAKTFFDIINKTQSPMGARLLNRWLSLPLKNLDEIQKRLDIVESIKDNNSVEQVLLENINHIGDLERLIAKVSTLRINPKEIEKLKEALFAIDPIKRKCQQIHNKPLNDLIINLNPCIKIRDEIEKKLHPNPPLMLAKGNVINFGVDQQLDELRAIKKSVKSFLDQMLEREIEKTSISSLKISYNNVFGYYLEVRNSHKDKVPEQWIRKQTLVNAERYITEELKEYEVKILSADEKISILEQKIYSQLVLDISKELIVLKNNARLISSLDCLLSFALISNKYNYSKPNLNTDFSIKIIKGRHPVIEQQLQAQSEFIPNDIFLDRDAQQVMMITGPNMSGKSAILRQTALIVLMAQIGCYVSADNADIGICDKIFTRVGASDNISMGESTFMVEMNETASILNNLSDKSLIILDEIGRGTSTYDGVSIAWAIAEYIHEHKTKAKTLFATHYHELNGMTKSFSRIKNYNVSIKETEKDIIFLRKLKEGGSNHSFGIHVAKMAGMPQDVVLNANYLLKKLESSVDKKSIIQQKNDKIQLSFFDVEDPVMKKIRDMLNDLEINNLTPIDALMKLNEIKKLTGNK